MFHHKVHPPLLSEYSGAFPPSVDTLWLSAGAHNELNTIHWGAPRGTYGPLWARLLPLLSTAAVAPTPWANERPPSQIRTLDRQSGGRRRRRQRRRRSAPSPWRAAAADGVPPAAGGPARLPHVGRLRQLRVSPLHDRRRHAAAAPLGLRLRCRRHLPPPPQRGCSASAAASLGPG